MSQESQSDNNSQKEGYEYNPKFKTIETIYDFFQIDYKKIEPESKDIRNAFYNFMKEYSQNRQSKLEEELREKGIQPNDFKKRNEIDSELDKKINLAKDYYKLIKTDELRNAYKKKSLINEEAGLLDKYRELYSKGMEERNEIYEEISKKVENIKLSQETGIPLEELEEPNLEDILDDDFVEVSDYE